MLGVDTLDAHLVWAVTRLEGFCHYLGQICEVDKDLSHRFDFCAPVFAIIVGG